MSRTTILDDATASDIDEQRHSQPVQFIKRGTAPFMRVTLALFPRAWRLSPPLLRSAYITCTFPGVWRLPASSSVSLSISTAMLAIGLLLPARFLMR